MSLRIYDGGQVVEEWDDVTRTYRRFEDGFLVEERPYTEAEAAGLVAVEQAAVYGANRRALLDKVAVAIQNDLDYLALDPPTTAQVIAQVERLTRQTVALLRLAANVLDDTNGT